MNSETILEALTGVRSEYILEAAPGQRKKSSWRIGWIAAALVLTSLLLFARTPVGVQAIEYMKQQVVSLIETLFPPRNVGINFEGEEMDIPHIAGGQEPTAVTETGEGKPGFAIYYDPEHYEMTEENGVTRIRPLSSESEEKSASDGLPPCEVEIRHLDQMGFETAAVKQQEEMRSAWKTVSEIQMSTEPKGMYFSAVNGDQWDSVCEDLYFVSDGLDGGYRITVKYFLEATEGHGARFQAMVKTFRVILS